MKKFLIVIGVMAGLQTGCASMNKTDCLGADWQSIGERDGLNGFNLDRADVYQNACAKHGVEVDLALYKQGHVKGAKMFCTAQNGFNLGKDGFEYQQSCPSNIEKDFLAGYADGRELYRVRVELNEVESDIKSAYRTISDNETQMEEKHDQMFADGMTSEMRSHLMSEIDRLNDQNKILDSQIMVLHGRYAELQEKYDDEEQRLDVYN